VRERDASDLPPLQAHSPGVIVTLSAVFRALNMRVDSAIGADRLKPGTRAQLLQEQIQGIAEMTPATAAGALVVSLVLVAIGRGTPALPAVAAWSAALYVGLFLTMRGWLRRPRGARKQAPSARALRTALINAGFMGVIWGTLPNLVLPVGDGLLTMTTCVVMAGVLCATGFALLILPQAAFAFSVPLLVGTFVAIAGLQDTGERFALTTLLLAYTLVMAFACMRYARNLVHHLASETKIREQKDIISLLLKEFEENSSDWLWEFDRAGSFQRVSDRFVAVSGVAKEQLIGLGFHDFLRSMGEAGDPVLEELKEGIDMRRTFSGVELRLSIAGVERFWRLTGKPTFDEFGRYAGYVGTASDVTAQKHAERRISFLAHNDGLTGLLNRAKFTEHLKQCVGRLERYGASFAVLYLDLDQFKAVNDRRGHMVGDKLLVQVAQRIRATLREADIAARLGGDEFAVILPGNCRTDEVAALAHRLVDAIGRSYELEEGVVSIGVSIGIAIAPLNGTRSDHILRNADLALYRAKAEGRGAYRFFETHMDSALRERRMLEVELHQGLQKAEFVLHYQPLVSAASNRPSGFEALVRWNHPVRGLILPAQFIPVSEQTGLIKQIGDWTIREACHAAARWPDDLAVAVNLSARHFEMPDIAAVVREALASSKLAPHRLELEITENVLMERTDEVMVKLVELKALGATITLDDFGTGYSSLSYLLKFPFDKIKIDRSFVMASSEDEMARDVLKSIASLGKALKITIVAEGVETQEQVDFLREIACTELQGYYFARPLDEVELARYFTKNFGRLPIQLSEALAADPALPARKRRAG
jgi:diguanylate cyclase (GGDEF)-like protein/PAS domain S-box-containing protein